MPVTTPIQRVFRSPASPFYSPKGVGPNQSNNSNNKNALSNIPILATAFLAILATGGPTYSFGVYAATLKHSLGLTQPQLETLGAASFAAGLISWIPGLIVDAWGSKSALMMGGSLQSVGFILYWMVARFQFLPHGMIVPILSSLSVLIFTSNNLVIGGVFKSIVVSCGLGTKGKAVGAAKAYLGLGAGVFSSLFRALPFVESDLDFLAMSSLCAIVAIVLPAALALPTSQQIGDKGTQDESTAMHYNLVYGGLFALCLVVVGTSAMDLLPTLPTSSLSLPEWLHGVVILAIWIGPILALFWLPTQSTGQSKQYQKQQSILRRRVRQAMERDGLNPTEKSRLILPTTTVLTTAVAEDLHGSESLRGSFAPQGIQETVQEVLKETRETPQPVEDLTLPEMLRTLRAWLFLGAATILVGAGTMLTINMGQMVQSLGLEPETAAACLSMFSVAQALARVTSGAVSESALQWNSVTCFGIRGIPRPAFLVLSCAFAVAGHVFMAAASFHLILFVLGIVLTGISFGALWPLMVLIIGDLFGTVNHGANYMFADGFTCALGTLSIAKFLTESVYEQHHEAGVPCLGEDCFRTTHMIISALCLVSLLACSALLCMTRSSYGTLLE